ncbi:MAG: DUF2905 domain-containing protein [Bryobacterales bacterium]|nr:DUF2905 domain-containing protein [Bryobacterales bacterium]
MGRLLIYAGAGLILLGLLVIAMNRLGVPFGRLPGDFVYRGKHTTVYIPLATCVLLSAALSLLAWLFRR